MYLTSTLPFYPTPTSTPLRIVQPFDFEHTGPSGQRVPFLSMVALGVFSLVYYVMLLNRRFTPSTYLDTSADQGNVRVK